ncbi:hypothetical protein V6N11_046116 [Hibiscus sabdariffa]|uniref:Reverse transcriptase zinc-binding domain-containing protein n=2 Tax=Hibiscus sabdariffa TaxID=183260 RepID=A0ABR2CU00_9ROSI
MVYLGRYNIIQRIVAIRPPHPSLSSNVLAWRWSDNQLFSSKLAYEKIAESEDWIHHTNWNVIWQKGVPERVRTFLWLSKSDCLLINKEWARRHLTKSLLCPICHTEEETVEHVLRSCPIATTVWNRSVQPSKLLEFMRLPFDDWFTVNLRNQGGFAMNIAKWDTFFLTLCWMLWKRRCRFAMEPGFVESSDMFTLCSRLAKDFARCNAARLGG